MYVGRKLSELNKITPNTWDIKELAYYYQSLSQMKNYLNPEGTRLYQEISNEIEERGGLPHDSGGWDHSSEIIFD